jgi:hypothetical protein
MHTGDWTFQACPQCFSDRIVRTVLANTTGLASNACRHNWTLRRMPSDAEAAEILQRSRQTRSPEHFTGVVGDVPTAAPFAAMQTESLPGGRACARPPIRIGAGVETYARDSWALST